MSYENRVTLDYAFGTLSSAASSVDTTLWSTAFASDLPSDLSTVRYVPITLQDPVAKTHEVVWATAHAAAGTSCVVVRGKENSTAQTWPAGTVWTAAPTLRDGVLVVANRAALPADPHVGMRAYLQDELTVVSWALGVGWVGASALSFRSNVSAAVDTATVTITGIPSTLKKVQVVWTARLNGGSSTGYPLYLRINSDNAAVYYATEATQTGTTASYVQRVSDAQSTAGTVPGAGAAAAAWGAGEIIFEGWNAPGGRAGLNWQSRSNFANTAGSYTQVWNACQYQAAGPYTALMLWSSFPVVAGSEFTVYGWA